MFPPGNTTWDGAGDNQAYLAGQAAFIANTGSVGIAARKDDPELFEATRFFGAARRPQGRHLADHAAAARHPEDERRTPRRPRR